MTNLTKLYNWIEGEKEKVTGNRPRKFHGLSVIAVQNLTLTKVQEKIKEMDK